MALRPAKRPRRSKVVQSDDDSSDTGRSSPPQKQSEAINSHLTRKQTATAKSATPQKRKLKASTPHQSPKSSPEKVRKVNKKVEPPNKSLHSFFGKATDEQRWKRKSKTPEVFTESTIEDDIVDEELDNNQPQFVGPNTGQAELRGQGMQTLADRLKQESIIASQKFVKPPVPLRNFNGQLSPESAEVDRLEHRPWADLYGPQNLEELAVHKKKAGDVQKWLQDMLTGKIRKQLLVLKGPAGSGKTSTISLLASAHGIDVIPWHNPTVSDPGNPSSIQQFADFLNRGGDFDALSFRATTEFPSPASTARQRLLLVEEFPTTTSRNSGTTNTFRSVLQHYLAKHTQTMQFASATTPSDPPVVLIISETLISSSTALADSFTAHRLLGPDISNHPSTTVIEFNPVAPTFVQKALDIVIRKEARDSKRRRMPGPAVLSKLAEIGDIRSAINSLEFFCARGDDTGNWSGSVALRSKKKDNVPLTKMEQDTLKLVSQRETTLDMFHAAGKIVYNKRDDVRVMDSRAQPPPRPPDHLLYLYNSKASQVDVEALLHETGTDIQTFISTLHENYVLSCNGDDFVDSFDGCSNVLSLSDILNPESRSLIRSQQSASIAHNGLQRGNFDMLKQDEISFQTASRGLLFYLPFPVERAVPPGARKQDAFKMFYPGSLRLWKPAEEIYDLLSMSIGRDIDQSLPAAGSSRGAGVSSWRSRGFGNAPVERGDTESSHEDDPPDPPRVTTSKDNYILDILPYRAQIHAARGLPDVQILRKITQVRGISMSSNEPDDGDDEDDLESFASSARIAEGGLSDSKLYSTPRRSVPGQAPRLSLGDRIQAAHNSLQNQSINQHRSASSSFSDAGNLKMNNQSFQKEQSNRNQPRNESNMDTSLLDKLYISDDDIQDD